MPGIQRQPPKLLASERPESGQPCTQPVTSFSCCHHWTQNVHCSPSGHLSWKNRIDVSGKDLQRSSSPAPCWGRVTWRRRHAQVGFECLSWVHWQDAKTPRCAQAPKYGAPTDSQSKHCSDWNLTLKLCLSSPANATLRHWQCKTRTFSFLKTHMRCKNRNKTRDKGTASRGKHAANHHREKKNNKCLRS